MTIYCLSSSRRFLKDGTPNNAGGVEKFGYYLRQAIGCEIVTPEDNISPNAGDTIIADGYYAGGWNTDKFNVISIVHGSWAEFAIRNNKKPDFVGEVSRQNAVWTNPKIKKVAVSQSAAKYLKIHHKVDADKIILNSVNTDLFKPVERHMENVLPVIIYVANCYNKDGQGRLGNIAEILKHKFEFRYLNASIGEEQDKFAQGDLFIQTSLYEGNSFAGIEAMSCGLPVIASQAGLFEDTEFDPIVGATVAWNASPEEFATAIEHVWWNHSLYKPRDWVLANADFEIFKKQWQDFIGGL